MFEIDKALRTLIEREGSDLHVKVNQKPTIRQHGQLVQLEGYRAAQRRGHREGLS